MKQSLCYKYLSALNWGWLRLIAHVYGHLAQACCACRAVRCRPPTLSNFDFPIDFGFKLALDSTCYDEWIDLSFPAPMMPDAEKRRLLGVPSKNTLKPLREQRAKDSVTLKDTIINTYQIWLIIGDRGGVCRACKLFINCSKMPRMAGKLLAKPWTSYSRAQDLRDHCKNEYHQDAMISMENFISANQGAIVPMSRPIRTQAKPQLLDHRDGHNSNVRTLVTCAQASIPPNRSRNESMLLESMASHDDEDVRIASDITGQIIRDINDVKYYTIIADEMRDKSNTELLFIAIRYYSLKTLCTEEKFLRFVPLRSLRGKF